MKIVIIGAKASGKSSLGRELRGLLDIPCRETDDLVVELYNKACSGEKKSCREIFDTLGEEEFRKLEEKAVASLDREDWTIVVTGGSTFVSRENRGTLRKNAIIVFCRCRKDILRKRVEKQLGGSTGINKAVFLKWYAEDVELKNELFKNFADIIVDTDEKSPAKLAEETRELLSREMAVRTSAPNTLGEIVRITSFGESHGPAVGVVLDGLAPGIQLSQTDIQKELDRRRPGQSKVSTSRKEPDKVQILSGVFEGMTTGSPIAMVIYNKDSDPSKYKKLKDLFRPGHADFTFYRKYAVRDHRGGGRSSGRETAARVAGGAVAKKILAERGVEIRAHAVEIAGVRAETKD